MTEPLLLAAYRAATAMAHPLAGPLIAWRLRRGKEDPTRTGERYGIASAERPAGPLVWVHAASVGETMAVLPLIERILAIAPLRVLLTTGTVTSARIAQTRLVPGLVHQYVPLDARRFVRRFLDHWRPELAIFAESELWPNMLMESSARGIPLALVNGRMSDRSYARWRQRGTAMARSLLARFDLCLAQSEADAERLRELGATSATAVGNLKFDVPAPPADAADLAMLADAMAGRPCWAAASLHPGEDEIAIAAHVELAATLPGLITILAPRHPERGGEVAAHAAEAGLKVARRSVERRPAADTEIFVMDSIGELGLVFRLAPVACMGGSLVPRGGQNPIEPAKLESAIVHGPHVGNFTGIYAALDQCGGAVPVDDAETLARAVGRLLRDPAEAAAACRAAAGVLARFSGALDRSMAELAPLLAPLARPG